MSGKEYKPIYSNSRALVVGIDQYQHASPLGFARSDAEAIAKVLREDFGFGEGVIELYDEAASRERILEEFNSFASHHVDEDERIIFYFAGHGHTITGIKGEVGFLIPNDGDIDRTNTLIRWDELTRGTELIPAKHFMFIMDACYGGLALKRAASLGSARFAKDMMCRLSRQVLTAGKADEPVADSGGPRPDHSIFTGHLLDALEGKAETPDGLTTAKSVMSYVYLNVASDYQSEQTPHSGFLYGDGDLIFNHTLLDDVCDLEIVHQEEEVAASRPVETAPEVPEESSAIEAGRQLKRYLSDPAHRIELHDNVIGSVRGVVNQTGEDSFPISGASVSFSEISERIAKYESAVSDLIPAVILLSKWGQSEHRQLLSQIFSRLPDAMTAAGGSLVLLELRWYPVSYLMYMAGISALSTESYENFRAVLFSDYIDERRGVHRPIIRPAVEGMLEVQRADCFKNLPGHEKHYVPRSEYLFNAVRPDIERHLFLGNDYERLFDRFELLLALVYADLKEKEDQRIWGPIGRFGWKFSSGSRMHDPFTKLLIEAAENKDEWGPLKAGFFGNSYERFVEVSTQYKALLERLGWF